MGLKNKKRDMTPYDMKRKPIRQPGLLLALLWGFSKFSTAGMKITKIRMEGLKPPFLVYSTHQGFSDYYIVPRMLYPHNCNYVSDMEGFAAFGNELYRAGGCIGKRRYVPDVNVLLNVRYALRELKQGVVIFPESRHCDAGITSNIPKNLGKLAKFLDVPLVVIYSHGAYLANPFWDEGHTRKVKKESTAELLYTAEELRAASEEEIQRRVEEKLRYDEYAWQKEREIKIKEKNRAEGLHLPLYQCRSCMVKGKMRSGKAELWCEACNKRWTLTEDGDLKDEVTGELSDVPSWYRWERSIVREAVERGDYKGIDVPVTVDALPNENGFVSLGTGRLNHDGEYFVLTLDEDEGITRDSFPLRIPNGSLESAQTEYNYRERGKCIVLSTRDCCYYVYSKAEEFLVTELEFAVEEINRLGLRFGKK